MYLRRFSRTSSSLLAFSSLRRSLSLAFALRTYRTFPALTQKALPPREKLNELDVTESFLRGGGPGGQKINKTSSAVQLIHHPTGIVVKAQDTRSRTQNRKIARQRLIDAIEVREKGSESRVSIKAADASRRKASAMKKRRRKYRALEGEKKSTQQNVGVADEAGEQKPPASKDG